MKRGELTPGFPSGPSVIYLHKGQNLNQEMGGVPDLVSKGQDIVINPQEVHGRCKQLCEFIHESILTSSPHGFEIGETTLADNLEKSMKPRTLQCKRERERTRTAPVRSRPALLDPFHPFKSVVLFIDITKNQGILSHYRWGVSGERREEICAVGPAACVVCSPGRGKVD